MNIRAEGLVLGSLVLVLLPAGPARGQSQRAFFTDFDDDVPRQFDTVRTVRSVDRLAGVGNPGNPGNPFSGDLLYNASGSATGFSSPLVTRFTLTGLPQHTSVDLNFLLAILNTWDAPADVLTIRVDGAPVFAESFSFFEPDARAYQEPRGALLTPRDERGYLRDYGFDSSHPDQAYDMSLEPRLHQIPHTADRLLVTFSTQPGFSGGTDESYGVDNFEVVLNGVVPEPAGPAALAAVTALVALRRRGSRSS